MLASTWTAFTISLPNAEAERTYQPAGTFWSSNRPMPSALLAIDSEEPSTGVSRRLAPAAVLPRMVATKQSISLQRRRAIAAVVASSNACSISGLRSEERNSSSFAMNAPIAESTESALVAKISRQIS